VAGVMTMRCRTMRSHVGRKPFHSEPMPSCCTWAHGSAADKQTSKLTYRLLETVPRGRIVHVVVHDARLYHVCRRACACFGHTIHEESGIPSVAAASPAQMLDMACVTELSCSCTAGGKVRAGTTVLHMHANRGVAQQCVLDHVVRGQVSEVDQ
jgi:hypothetical protein